jgi:membrane carboxypeptidase/penicillin-binding protein PbpC
VISMNTCSDWHDTNAGKINTCLEPRQVWSAIKPFLYLHAFQKNNIKSSDTIVDEPVSFDLWDGNTYSPKNFDLSYHGEVSYAYALWNSLNVPAIKTLNALGVEPFLAFLKTQLASYAPWLDKNTKDANNVWLSLALWTYEISPLAFTQLWRVFVPWVMIPWYERNTQEIITIMSNPQNRIVSFWQDSFLNVPWRAVKTGTSRKFVDGRVCWVHQQKWLTLCLWLWNINNETMKGPSSEVGSYIWSVIAKGL